MQDNQITLAQFRKMLLEEYTRKGVQPPTLGGEKEKQLYQIWLKGREKLQGVTK